MLAIIALRVSRDFKLKANEAMPVCALQGAAVPYGESGNNSKTTNQNTSR